MKDAKKKKETLHLQKGASAGPAEKGKEYTAAGKKKKGISNAPQARGEKGKVLRAHKSLL